MATCTAMCKVTVFLSALSMLGVTLLGNFLADLSALC
jgi:hypothetical protein